jgi:hypothetical protein
LSQESLEAKNSWNYCDCSFVYSMTKFSISTRDLSVKIRLSIVALAVLIGMGWKLGRGDFDRHLSQSSVATTDFQTTSDATSTKQSPATGPLVEPIQVAGYMPNWNTGGQSASQHFLALADEFAHDATAAFHAHGEEVCASGCAASSHPTKELTRERFSQLLGRFAIEPMNEDSPALDSLVYFGRQTRKFIEAKGFGPLDQQRSRFLWDELARNHAKIAIRVVDEHGEVRSWIEPTKVPLDRRHVFDMQTNGVQPLVTSGTVKRTKLGYLWTRL